MCKGRILLRTLIALATAVPGPAPAASVSMPPPPGPTSTAPPFTRFSNQTLRQIVRATIGGSRVRVIFSNAFGTAPLTIGAAHIALRDQEDVIQPRGHSLMFSGHPSVTIPPLGVVYTDPLTLDVPALSDVAIDVYLPGTTNVPPPLTTHTSSFQTTYISETGNHAGAAKFPTVATARNWFLLLRVEVDAPDALG